MRLEGVATPVPFPCVIGGGDDHRPLRPSARRAATLSGFLTLRDIPPGWRARRSLAAMFLGEDLLAYLVLAIGAAMAVGSVAALVRPPDARREGDLERPPLGRSIAFAVVGAAAAVWALASLLAG